nr:unnamed protein product [Trichobilharzia regenti]
MMRQVNQENLTKWSNITKNSMKSDIDINQIYSNSTYTQSTSSSTSSSSSSLSSILSSPIVTTMTTAATMTMVNNNNKINNSCISLSENNQITENNLHIDDNKNCNQQINSPTNSISPIRNKFLFPPILTNRLLSAPINNNNNHLKQLNYTHDTTTNNSGSSSMSNSSHMLMSREEALVTLSEKTSYPILQENGQRRYGPPPNWSGPQPPRGCEVFIGKIPRDCFEDELVPIFELVGKIYMFRLMMDFSGCNRGYGFCIYTNREDTKRAVAELDCYEIRKGKMLGVCFSIDNCRLFVGGIPKSKTKEEIMVEMLKVTEGVKDVIVYPSVADKTKNRGFAFVEYENHKAAAMARRKLIPGRIHLWGHQIAVDWAEPEREVDENIMSKVRILYVRNLMLHTTEDAVKDHFNQAIGAVDAVERVKKIRDYAFVHFRDRLQATTALRQLDGTLFDGSQIEVTWAKPVDKNENVKLNRNSNGIITPNHNNNNTTTINHINYNNNNNNLAFSSFTNYFLNPLNTPTCSRLSIPMNVLSSSSASSSSSSSLLSSPVSMTLPSNSCLLASSSSAVAAPLLMNSVNLLNKKHQINQSNTFPLSSSSSSSSLINNQSILSNHYQFNNLSDRINSMKELKGIKLSTHDCFNSCLDHHNSFGGYSSVTSPTSPGLITTLTSSSTSSSSLLPSTITTSTIPPISTSFNMFNTNHCQMPPKWNVLSNNTLTNNANNNNTHITVNTNNNNNNNGDINNLINKTINNKSSLIQQNSIRLNDLCTSISSVLNIQQNQIQKYSNYVPLNPGNGQQQNHHHHNYQPYHHHHQQQQPVQSKSSMFKGNIMFNQQLAECSPTSNGVQPTPILLNQSSSNPNSIFPNCENAIQFNPGCINFKDQCKIDSDKLLMDICLKNGFGSPKFTTLTQSYVDQLTGKKMNLYTGQVYLPNLSRQFISNNPSITIERSIKLASEAAIHWLFTHYFTNTTINNNNMSSNNNNLLNTCKFTNLNHSHQLLQPQQEQQKHQLINSFSNHDLIVSNNGNNNNTSIIFSASSVNTPITASYNCNSCSSHCLSTTLNTLNGLTEQSPVNNIQCQTNLNLPPLQLGYSNNECATNNNHNNNNNNNSTVEHLISSKNLINSQHTFDLNHHSLHSTYNNINNNDTNSNNNCNIFIEDSQFNKIINDDDDGSVESKNNNNNNIDDILETTKEVDSMDSTSHSVLSIFRNIHNFQQSQSNNHNTLRKNEFSILSNIKNGGNSDKMSNNNENNKDSDDITDEDCTLFDEIDGDKGIFSKMNGNINNNTLPGINFMNKSNLQNEQNEQQFNKIYEESPYFMLDQIINDNSTSINQFHKSIDIINHNNNNDANDLQTDIDFISSINNDDNLNSLINNNNQYELFSKQIKDIENIEGNNCLNRNILQNNNNGDNNDNNCVQDGIDFNRLIPNDEVEESIINTKSNYLLQHHHQQQPQQQSNSLHKSCLISSFEKN